MRPVALALLAGLLVVALFQIVAWQSDEDLEVVADEAGGRPAEVLRGQVGSAPGDETPNLTAPAGSPDRQQIAAGKVRVTGQLIGPKGAAVVGTRMHLHLGSKVPNPFAGFNPNASAAHAPAAVTHTDGEGRFAFDVPVQKAGYIALGDGDLVWKKKPPRFLGSEVDLNLGALTVHMGAVLRGSVVSEYDVPIEAVNLHCTSFEHYGSRRTTKSDKNGSFELRGLPGGLAYLTVTRQGYVAFYQQVEMELGKARDGLVLRLRQGDALMGFVVDDRSKPIEGAAVRAHGNGRSVGDGSYEYSNGTAKTDKNGEFHVTGLGVGPYRVTVSAKGHVASNQSNVKLQTRAMRFELTRTASIAGRLVDERGSPLEDSRVFPTTKPPSDKSPRNGRHVSRPGRGVKTDADGQFTLENIKPGRIWLVANGNHRLATHGPLQIVAGQRITDLELQAERGGVVLVHVSDPEGEPVENARVTLRPPNANAGSPRSTRGFAEVLDAAAVPNMRPPNRAKTIRGKTDKDGNCELAGVDAGSYVVSAAHADWVAAKPVDLNMPASGRTETQVTMTAGGRVAVSVVDHRGKAVAEQAFRIYVAGAGAGAAAGTDKNGKPRKPRPVKSGRTDATGRATLGPIAPGAYEAVLELTAEGGGMYGMMYWGNYGGGHRKELGPRVPFRVVANQTTDVSLTRPKLASLSGTVMDDGGPVRNAQLVLSPDTKGPNGGFDMAALRATRRVRSDADGIYRFEGLQPGKYSIAVLRRKGEMNFMKQVQIPSVSDHHQDLFLSVGSVEVVVKLKDKPVGGVKLSLNLVRNAAGNAVYYMVGSAGSTPKVTTDASGVASFEGIPADARYTLRIQGKDYLQPKQEPFQVSAGSVTRRELALQESATLTVTVVAAPGTKKLTMVRLEVKPVGGGKPKSRWMRRGQPRTDVYAPGRYEVRAQRYGRRRPGERSPWSQTRTVELRVGKQTKMEIIVP